MRERRPGMARTNTTTLEVMGALDRRIDSPGERQDSGA